MGMLPLYTLAITTLTAGCVTTALAPGAAQVKIVRKAADVAACTAVGNVSANVQGAAEDARNLTVGLGGNTIFVTTENLTGIIYSGVAYRCP
jgi:hypothetical protein